MEAASFQQYLESAALLSYGDARERLRGLSAGNEGGGDGGQGVELSVEDYVLGVYDMTGELMRFAITAMATSGDLPTIPATDNADNTNNDSDDTGGGAMDIDHQASSLGPPSQQRNLLTDMRHLRSALESLDAGSGPFAKDADKKAEVMRTSVEKVEKALYGLIVRGAERPKGWMPPDMGDAGGGRREVEV